MKLSKNFIADAKEAFKGAIIGVGLVGYVVSGYQIHQFYQIRTSKPAAIISAQPIIAEEQKPSNSKKGTAFMLDYELLNAKDSTQAVDAIDIIGRLPEHYRKILWLQGTKVVIAASDADLPAEYKEPHDRNLAMYKKELGTEKLCGIQLSKKTAAMINPTAVTLLHCDSAPRHNLHELAHAFDVSAAYLFTPGFDELSSLPRFQSLYCGKLKETNPKADCDKKMPNGSPEYKEVFADAFSLYYLSPSSNDALSQHHSDLHEYLTSLEVRLREKMIEIKQ